ncbi:MAG: hypothetical protein AMS27_04845 [Bacteroides sp. SM23_62_1]|nr:MAG: hypothetical protein AMS27_04845 [Bacteroides sp. SM23_62_1]
MKTGHFFSMVLLLVSIVIPIHLFGQENDQGRPEMRWDVNKEFDKNGNILRYDSSYIFHWKSPGADAFNHDSLFSAFPFFFRSNPDCSAQKYDSLFSDHPGLFPDPFDDEFFFDFSYKHHPFIFRFPSFPDLDEPDPMNSPFFFSDSMFSMPFQDPFLDDLFIRRFFDWPLNDSIHSWHYMPFPFYLSFPDFDEFFKESNKLIEKYFNEHLFYLDTIPSAPNQYTPPGTRKKPYKEIDI